MSLRSRLLAGVLTAALLPLVACAAGGSQPTTTTTVSAPPATTTTVNASTTAPYAFAELEQNLARARFKVVPGSGSTSDGFDFISLDLDCPNGRDREFTVVQDGPHPELVTSGPGPEGVPPLLNVTTQPTPEEVRQFDLCST